MRTRVRKFAHVLERLGLAMAGAASGLFVGVHVGSNIAVLTSEAFVLIMMVCGAIGFYLGIDTPQLIFHPKESTSTREIDAAELLSAIGTFLATLVAFFAVGVVVLRSEPHIALTAAIMVGWVFGVAMQIVAGTMARIRA
ncbi:hypothetical protein ACFFWD_26715 [Bradyrhizobium erythrophlei]|uniref:hypothetical protein n=1 Tax=Bradyrhizobium erythrophlei TaxID=1437360 RepID=UPI0035E8DAF6